MAWIVDKVGGVLAAAANENIPVIAEEVDARSSN
jgi:hypothetical protein